MDGKCCVVYRRHRPSESSFCRHSVGTVGGLSTPAKVPERRILDLMLCSPPLNYIQLRQWPYAAAVVENAGHLRLPIEILVDDALSPFHVLSGRDSAGNETKDSTSDATSASSRTVPITDSIKPDLKPTAIQLNTAHHPCYDLLLGPPSDLKR